MKTNMFHVEHVLGSQWFKINKVVIYQVVTVVLRFDKTVSLFERANAESANNKRQCFTWNIRLKPQESNIIVSGDQIDANDSCRIHQWKE